MYSSAVSNYLVGGNAAGSLQHVSTLDTQALFVPACLLVAVIACHVSMQVHW